MNEFDKPFLSEEAKKALTQALDDCYGNISAESNPQGGKVMVNGKIIYDASANKEKTDNPKPTEDL